ncbi:MAG: cupredoxin domain-containing protein [Bacteroidota bacterium]
MRKYGVFVIVLAAALVLASCGGGSKGAAPKINVTMTDFKFTPDTFTIPAGKEISFTARNNGAVTHDFIIMKLGTNAGDNYGPEDEPNVFWKTEVPAGQTSTETFTAPSEPGEYQVLCGVPGHYVAGMSAKLTVVAP